MGLEKASSANQTQCPDSVSCFSPIKPIGHQMRGGIPSAGLGFVKNTVPESRASTKNTISDTQSIRICVAIHFLVCSVAGAAALPTPGPTPERPAKSLTLSGAASASENTLGRGIDVSRSAGEPTLQDLENIKQQGYRFVIVSGWGGVNRNGHARVQLSRARSAGLLTAGYCYLNFASPLDGASQVREALAAFGPEAAHLGFLAIDIETSARNQLSPGLRLDPPDASAQQQAITRITEAVQQVQEMSLRTVIYTKKSDWQRITGDTQQFKDLPLWNPKTIGGDDLAQPDLGRPAHTFGGWTSRVGKQYELDTDLNNPPIKVDLNVFDLRAFSGSNPNFSLRPSDTDVPALVVKK